MYGAAIDEENAALRERGELARFLASRGSPSPGAYQGRRCKDSGMSGIVNKATCFETTKPKIDYEHSITRVMCANCHKLDDTDNGI